jgi:hypothetical protein
MNECAHDDCVASIVSHAVCNLLRAVRRLQAVGLSHTRDHRLADLPNTAPDCWCSSASRSAEPVASVSSSLKFVIPATRVEVASIRTNYTSYALVRRAWAFLRSCEVDGTAIMCFPEVARRDAYRGARRPKHFYPRAPGVNHAHFRASDKVDRDPITLAGASSMSSICKSVVDKADGIIGMESPTSNSSHRDIGSNEIASASAYVTSTASPGWSFLTNSRIAGF